MDISASLPLERRIYTPEPLLGHPVKMLGDLFRDLWAGRELAWRLIVRDLSAQYRQSYFGYVWAFLPPLVASLPFIFLNSQGILQTGETRLPYVAFAMIGTLLWQVFVDSLNAPTSAINQAKPMLAKINFPREAIILAGLGMVGFNFLVRLVLLIGVLIFYHVPVGSTLFFFPVTIGALVLCGMALGMAVAPLGALYGDVGRAIPMIASFWMLLTPVVYPPKTHGVAGFLSAWNPVSPLIVTARQAVSGEALTHLVPFWIVFGVSGLLLLLGFIGFRITMPHLIARMGG